MADGVIAEAHAVESKEIKPFAEHRQGIFEVKVENGVLDCRQAQKRNAFGNGFCYGKGKPRLAQAAGGVEDSYCPRRDELVHSPFDFNVLGPALGG